MALGGTSAPDWIAKACAFRRVLLAFDNDAHAGGEKAAQSLMSLLQSRGAKVARLAPLREEGADKSDWNMMLLQHGAAPLAAWLRARIAHTEYFEWGAL